MKNDDWGPGKLAPPSSGEQYAPKGDCDHYLLWDADTVLSGTEKTGIYHCNHCHKLFWGVPKE